LGKSTWACSWPDPIALPTEDGLSHIDVPSFPLAESVDDVGGPLLELQNSEHEFKTLVLDSADWLEQLIWKQVCQADGKKCMSDFAYGKGHSMATAKFRWYLQSLDTLRKQGMHIVITAHSVITRFEDPAGLSYDRYSPKLHRDASALLQEWADEVLFVNLKTFTKTQDEGFGRERAIGIGTGQRVLYTQETPAYLAKNRLGLPTELPLDFSSYLPFLNGDDSNG